VQGVRGSAGARPRASVQAMSAIHVGDCIAWMETLPDRFADVLITDPPYSDATHAKSRSAPLKGLRNPSGKSGRKTVRARDLGFASLTPALMRDFAIEAQRVTARWVLVFCDDRQVGAWRYELQGAGLEVVRTCPWVKPDCAPQLSGDRPGAGWEAIMVAHQTNDRGRPTLKRWNGGGHRGVYTHGIPRARDGRVHTTEKPIALMLELVDHFTEPGDLVLDPFAGSGTTGVACIRRGRRFLGAELDADVAAIATARLAAEASGSSLAAVRAGQEPLFGAS
jgi:hypothetical protein